MSTCNEPLAIVGMSCRFPSNIENMEDFWTFLMDSKNAITAVPEERWNNRDWQDLASRIKKNPPPNPQGGFISDVKKFDANFFSISANAARNMDPQQRVFLETAIHALEHANIAPRELKSSQTGVYCGVATHEFEALHFKAHYKIGPYTRVGISNSSISGRLAYYLGLNGPNMIVDTACSSSLSALYVAAMDLQAHNCDSAIVGGVHLAFCPETFAGYNQAGFISPTGECRAFSQDSNGFVSSEGCGVIIVKRLSDAIKSKDTIYAVLRSIVMNQDGKSDGFCAPNPSQQIKLLQRALEKANCTPDAIQYIETHGTGTPVGDPIEFNAIQSVFKNSHSRQNPLVLGSVKTQLGHTISTAGIAGLMKTVYALHKNCIPSNLHYNKPHQDMDLSVIPSLIPKKNLAWPRMVTRKRRAQVNSFSYTGTSVCAIIEEAPIHQITHQKCNGSDLFLVISAQSKASLAGLLEKYSLYLKNTSDAFIDICYTAACCRDHYKHRIAIQAKDLAQCLNKIENKQWADFENLNQPHSYPKILADYIQGIEVDWLNYFMAFQGLERVQLPLYFFDRKEYWPEKEAYVAKKNHWTDSLFQKTKDIQLIIIQDRLCKELSVLLGDKSIDANKDFEELGLDETKRACFDKILQSLFLGRCTIVSKVSHKHISVSKLALHIHQQLFPSSYTEQPVIKSLEVQPIAIIGMSCRFPKAHNIDAFRRLLETGESGMIDIPKERWDNEKFYSSDPDEPGKLYIKQLGFIDNEKLFDANFFNITPREAKLIAPQTRVYLEQCFHAIENANLPLNALKNSNTGVFVGVGTNEYPRLLAEYGINLDDLNVYFATGNVLNAVAGRVAYAFDLKGPIQAIDTACSSSSTAIHNACNSLQTGDCDIALAGGVNMLLVPDSNITLSKARMLSPDSRCNTFSFDANGYARSEGCGVVVLKRLEDAVKDKDNILALIKGSAINSDGLSSGFTVPNGSAQEQVIRKALAVANLDPKDIDAIEAHGTGTPLADPIEVNTLMRIFAKNHNSAHPLYISSVKTNIGHCESASGIAGIIKAILSLQYKTHYKHLNFKKLNPYIELENSIIPSQNTKWKAGNRLRRVGVSSFGFSGANSHIILEEYKDPYSKDASNPCSAITPLVISAKSRGSLKKNIKAFQQYLATTNESFYDICYTAATCRTHFNWRIVIQAKSNKDACEQLKHILIPKECTVSKGSLQDTLSLENSIASFLQGYDINWDTLLFNKKGKKVNLPSYEFDREKFWPDDKSILKDEKIPKDWIYQIKWKEISFHPAINVNDKTKFLFVGDDISTNPLSNQHHCTFTTVDELSNLEHYDAVLYLASNPLVDEPKTSYSIELIPSSTSHLLRFLKKIHATSKALNVYIITQNSTPEFSNSSFQTILNSTIRGLAKTALLELKNHKLYLLDFEVNKDKDVYHQFFDFNSKDIGNDRIVSCYNGKYYAPRLENESLINQTISLHGKGRYLITGGTGGLGLVAAKCLLSAGAREILLVSRNIDKPQFLYHLKNLKKQYPARLITPIQCDVARKAEVDALFDNINTDGQLKGIIHAAGVGVKKYFHEHDDSDIDYIFPAKVLGGWNLHLNSLKCDLDFFTVYSSISSAIGSNKESIYASANAFLDALIDYRQKRNMLGNTIHWGPWGQSGMAKNRAKQSQLENALISDSLGQGALRKILANNLSSIVVISPDYLQFMLEFTPSPQPKLHEKIQALIGKKDQKPLKTTTWFDNFQRIELDKRLQYVTELVYQITQQILELDDKETIDRELGFYDIGFDSLMITELASELKKHFPPLLKIKVNIGFDYPSIRKLSDYLYTQAQSIAPDILNVQESNTSHQDTDIAVIGMACNFPNASNIFSFEKLLRHGKHGFKEIPISRWDNQQYYDSDPQAPGKSYVKELGLIDNIEKFDCHFFDISPREAKYIEPQQRVFLETCYHALEHANYSLNQIKGTNTGVFAGVGPNEYFMQLEKNGFSNDELSSYSITGNVLNIIPGRVSYFFDLKGPSQAVDTACSSSLVSIHNACQSLAIKESNLALAGGVNILLLPESNVTLCKAQALSKTNRCKTFDADADGYARAEGCGVVVLKRLADAIENNDKIYAVIKGTAVNSDGRSAGLTVPNGKAQEEVMTKALNKSGLRGDEIELIETHGTATPLGDPIEVNAINSVYGKDRATDNPLFISSVKTNIGHLESAAGVAGLIKLILSLQHEVIYKHLNFNSINPHIELDKCIIPKATQYWESKYTLRAGGVSAFGFSGTNAHCIIQQYPQQKIIQEVSKHNYILPISAKSQHALTRLVDQYLEFLKNTESNFKDICFTAAIARQHYSYRFSVIATTNKEAVDIINDLIINMPNRQDYKTSIPQHAKLLHYQKAYLSGNDIDWQKCFETEKNTYNKVPIPLYAFDKQEYWIKKQSHHNNQPKQIHPLLGCELQLPNAGLLFQNDISKSSASYISTHKIFDETIFPCSAFIETGVAIAKALNKLGLVELKDFHIERTLKKANAHCYQTQAKSTSKSLYNISIHAQDSNAQWTKHAQMTLNTSPHVKHHDFNIPELMHSDFTVFNQERIYARLQSKSFFYKDEEKILAKSWVKNDLIISQVDISPYYKDEYNVSPFILDMAMQSLLLLDDDNKNNHLFLPYAFKRLQFNQTLTNAAWFLVQINHSTDVNELSIELIILDDKNNACIIIEDLRLRRATKASICSNDLLQSNSYRLKWTPYILAHNNRHLLADIVCISNHKPLYSCFNGMNVIKTEQVKDIKKSSRIIYIHHENDIQSAYQLFTHLTNNPPNLFIIITQAAYASNFNAKVNPYHTMIASYWKSFSNELCIESNYLIDIDSKADPSSLIYKLTKNVSSNKIYRIDNNQEVFSCSISNTKIYPSKTDTAIIKNEGCYLIAGGFEGLASVVIDYLVVRGATKIVLINRSKTSSDWKEQYKAYSKRGIAISHVQLDASDYQALSSYLRKLIASQQTINGVFILSATLHDKLIHHTQLHELNESLSSKVDVSLNFHQATQNLELDLFVMFSSSASILGPAGQAAYAAGNGFLDGLSYLRRMQNLPAISINWGPWNNIGLTKNLTPYLHEHGFAPFNNSAIYVLDALLNYEHPQVMIAKINWDKINQKRIASHWIRNHINNNENEENTAPERTQNFKEIENIENIEETILTIISSIMEHSEQNIISKNDDLYRFGYDSLMAVEFRNKVHDVFIKYKVNIPIEYFISKPSVASISQKVISTIDSKDNESIAAENKVKSSFLTDFQLIYWINASNKISFNIGSQIRLKGALCNKTLENAISEAVATHSIFWLNIDMSLPMQSVGKSLGFNIDYSDLSLETNNNEAILTHKFRSNILQYIPLNKGPLLKVYLYKLNNSLFELQLIVPHIIADDASIYIFFEQIKRNYTNILKGVNTGNSIANNYFIEYANQEHSSCKSNLLQKRKFWREYGKKGCLLLLPNHCLIRDAYNKKYYNGQYLAHININRNNMDHLFSLSKLHAFNPSNALIAIMQIALFKVNQQKNTSIRITHSARSTKDHKGIIGLFSEYKCINIFCKADISFLKMLELLDEELLITADHQKCPIVIKEQNIKGNLNAFFNPLLLKCMFYKRYKRLVNQGIPKENCIYILQQDLKLHYNKNVIKMKQWINCKLRLNIAYKKPRHLRVIYNVTAGFYNKSTQKQQFSNIEYNYPNHFEAFNRFTGSESLSILFSRNERNDYIISMNGPITHAFKDYLANNFNLILDQVINTPLIQLNEVLNRLNVFKDK